MNFRTHSLASDLEMSRDSLPACEERFLNEPGQKCSKPLLLTQSWVSTFFVQLRGAVRCIAWSQRATSINHFNIFELLTSTSHHPSRSGAELPTWHMHHAAVAVVHQIACFAVDATGRDAVAVKEVGIHCCHFTVSPGRRKINQLFKHTRLNISETSVSDGKVTVELEFSVSDLGLWKTTNNCILMLNNVVYFVPWPPP